MSNISDAGLKPLKGKLATTQIDRLKVSPKRPAVGWLLTTFGLQPIYLNDVKPKNGSWNGQNPSTAAAAAALRANGLSPNG
jgi:hypothetical protein